MTVMRTRFVGFLAEWGKSVSSTVSSRTINLIANKPFTDTATMLAIDCMENMISLSSTDLTGRRAHAESPGTVS